MCEGFVPGDNETTPNNKFLLNHHTKTQIAICSNPHQYHSLNCKVLVLPGDEHKNQCNECYKYSRSKERLMKRNNEDQKLDDTSNTAKKFVNDPREWT